MPTRMRLPALCLVALSLACLAGCTDDDLLSGGGASSSLHAGSPTRVKSFDFEAYPPGRLPLEFTSALTGGGGPPAWVIMDDPFAAGGRRVLAQTAADPTSARYPVCVYEGLQACDVDVSVRFKAVSGKVDQAAGLVVRYKDKDNYYVARANALENDVRFFKVERGQRTELTKADRGVPDGQWHSLKLSAKGSRFEVFYDGDSLFQSDDTTFAGPGLAGVWTKADSVTYFDDLQIESFDPR